MNLRLFLCIAMGVFVAHLGVVMLLSHLRPQPRLTPPPRNFSVRSQSVTDPKTGEKTTYREITVSTRVAAAPTPVATSDSADLSAAKKNSIKLRE